MVKITADLVKKLRERTGAGIMDCKRVLMESYGDIERAIENMRKYGAIKAWKKAGNIAKEGMIQTKIKGKYGVIIEVNCETDFVVKNALFQKWVKKVLDTAIKEKITNVEVLKNYFEGELVAIIAHFGEQINIRRISYLEGEILGSYQHGTRIGVLVLAKGIEEELVKKIAMHIAASNPEFIHPENVSSEIIKKEYKYQLDLARNSGKKKEIINQIVEGRMKKFTREVSLTGQYFIIDPNKTIEQILKEHDADVTNFIRFEVGEGIVKK